MIRIHKDHRACWPVPWLCRMLEVQPSGFHTWLHNPRSDRQKANQRVTGLIKQFWLESGGVYGYRKIHSDLRDVGGPVASTASTGSCEKRAQKPWRVTGHHGPEGEIAMPLCPTACSASSVLRDRVRHE